MKRRMLMVDYEADRELVLSGTKDGGGEDMTVGMNDALNRAIDKEFGQWRGKGEAPKGFVKRHFLECELKTADDLIVEYMEYAEDESTTAANRLKLVWLLERLQEEVL